eukprot:jgi/Mesvir1/1766/Mv09619-RA.1
MYSVLYRSNAFFTFAATVLACVCLFPSLTDRWHKATPDISLELARVESLQAVGDNDQAILVWNLTADLSTVFSWNTKQLFVYLVAEYVSKDNVLNQAIVWDAIIQRREDAQMELHELMSKYRLVDQGRNLKGRPMDVYLCWDVMPIAGALYKERSSATQIQLPKEYRRGMRLTPYERGEGRF